MRCVRIQCSCVLPLCLCTSKCYRGAEVHLILSHWWWGPPCGDPDGIHFLNTAWADAIAPRISLGMNGLPPLRFNKLEERTQPLFHQGRGHRMKGSEGRAVAMQPPQLPSLPK
ncbi:hypothetical protein TRVL_09519 [Trypanosoma vivax]|nr:hypothetical protein TRVL_09519 [Trypanosoma vivax]